VRSESRSGQVVIAAHAADAPHGKYPSVTKKPLFTCFTGVRLKKFKRRCVRWHDILGDYMFACQLQISNMLHCSQENVSAGQLRKTQLSQVLGRAVPPLVDILSRANGQIAFGQFARVERGGGDHAPTCAYLGTWHGEEDESRRSQSLGCVPKMVLSP
jgi:hypothetical protein